MGEGKFHNFDSIIPRLYILAFLSKIYLIFVDFLIRKRSLYLTKNEINLNLINFQTTLLKHLLTIGHSFIKDSGVRTSVLYMPEVIY